MTALEAARAIARGFARAHGGDRCALCPMADGGEGTVQAFVDGGAAQRSVRVQGPLGDSVDAAYAVEGERSIVELASASGLALVPPKRRDVMRASTAGFGEIIRTVLDHGATSVLAGIGGSATNDVGTGMARVLGARFLDEGNKPIDGPIAAFEQLSAIDLATFDPRVANTAFDVASDVDNPLTGQQGAAAVFAAQKGASREQIAQLERIAGRIADVTATTLGRDLRNEPGAGAAGGVGFALIAFFGARIHAGAELIARERGLPRLLEHAALCATGEGRIDMQTLHGKTVSGVAAIARDRGVRVVAFGGKVEDDAREALEAQGIDVRQTALPAMSTPEAIARGEELLERAAYEYAVERR